MEEKVNSANVDEGISFADLWNVFKKHFVAILSVMIVFAVGAGIFSKMFVKTEYTATATLVINAKYIYEEPNSVNVSYDNAAITFGKNVLPTFVSTIKDTDVVRDEVNKLVGVEDCVERIGRGAIKVSYEEENLLVSVSYTTKSSRKVAAATVTAVSDVICSVSNEVATDKDGNPKQDEKGKPIYKYPFANSVFSVQNPTESTVSASNKGKTYTVLAAIVALVLAYLFFFILERIDDTAFSKKDIEKCTGFDVIAYVSDASLEEKGDK